MNWDGIFKNASGLCLTELMIAMTAGAIVLAASLESLDHFQRRMLAQQERLIRQQDVRIGMRVLEAELRLAGSGGPPTAAPLLQAGPQTIEFLANLDGYSSSLTKAVSAHQRELFVVGGANWPKGKRVWVCGEEQCAEGRLARTGQDGRLSLAEALGQAFPAGSAVFVSNQVRYYLGKDQTGKRSLMRQVDGGASTLIGGVTSCQVRYLDENGSRTTDPALVDRIHISLQVENGPRQLTYEVSLRGR